MLMVINFLNFLKLTSTIIFFCLIDVFIKQQLLDFNIGKRHLANMMGKDPEFFSQDDIDVIS